MMEPKPKKMKAFQRYRMEYTKEWPCIIKSQKSENHVFCTVCSSDFLILHGGRDDCRRHVESKKHLDNGRMKFQNSKINSFFSQNQNSNEENSVIKAEMLFMSFLVEHNAPMASADHAGPLFRAMFPDSKIAEKYGCARTKTNAIVQDMAKWTQEEITNFLQNHPFALATDGSNDSDDKKLYPIIVSFYNEPLGKIDTLLLSICQTNDNTGEGIFNLLNEEMMRKKIPWKNCISFASDNAYTMVGHVKGVVAFLHRVQPSMINIGCSCHLLHLAAKKATAELKSVLIEDILVKLYFFLDKSSKRKNSFKLCQDVYGLKPHKILKYVSTRWLSLLDSINRILEQWDAISKYFCTESCSSDLKYYLEDPITKLYCLFLSNVLPLFNSVNVALQIEAPSIHTLRRQLLSFFSNLLVRFVKPTALPENSDSILEITFLKRKYQKDDEDLVIGGLTRSYIKDEKISPKQLSKFYEEVRNFYCTACTYILKKFPLNDEFLKHAEVADINLRKCVSFASVTFFATKLESVLSKDESDLLEAEFASYQFETCDGLSTERMDKAWFQISQLVNVSGQKKYKALPKLMLTVLLIPHSNAVTERVFSIVRKNQTEFRPTLGISTLNALLIEKVKSNSNKENCYQKNFSAEQLNSAKKATKLSLMGNE